SRRRAPSASLAADLRGERLLLALSLDRDLDRVAGLVVADDLAELLVRGDVLAVDLQDDVARLEPRLVRPAAGHDVPDEGALLGLDLELLEHGLFDRVERHRRDAEPRGVGRDLA